MYCRSILVVLALMISGHLQGRLVPVASAAASAKQVSWTYKSFTIVAQSQDDLYGSGPALKQLAGVGANAVAFVVTWYTPSINSTDIYTTVATASDGALIWAMQHAESLGLKVIIKPHLDSQDGQWRAYINPPNAAAWFASYSAMIDHYAVLANRYGADMLCIGSELISLSTNPTYASYWTSLIAGVRQRLKFRGRLTYSANWGSRGFGEEFPRLTFWSQLDYLGISAYFPLSTQPDPSVGSMKRAWATWQASAIFRFHARQRKPLLFTEIGYRSAQGTSEAPFDSGGGRQPDQQAQANCYEALFESWATVPWFAGSMFWFWSLDMTPDPSGAGFEVQHKAAYGTVLAWYGGPRHDRMSLLPMAAENYLRHGSTPQPLPGLHSFIIR